MDAVPANLPSLSADDRALLDAFLAADLDILTLHRTTRRPIAFLIAWLRIVGPWLDELHRALELAEKHARSLAIGGLARLIQSAPSPIEARRAATTLLRSIGRAPAGAHPAFDTRPPDRAQGVVSPAASPSRPPATGRAPRAAALPFAAHPTRDIADAHPGITPDDALEFSRVPTAGSASSPSAHVPVPAAPAIPRRRPPDSHRPPLGMVEERFAAQRIRAAAGAPGPGP